MWDTESVWHNLEKEIFALWKCYAALTDSCRISEQPIGPIFRGQSETSPLLYRRFETTCRFHIQTSTRNFTSIIPGFRNNLSILCSRSTWNFTTVIPAFRINLSARYSKVNLELHHNYKKVSLLKYILSHLNAIYTFYQFP